MQPSRLLQGLPQKPMAKTLHIIYVCVRGSWPGWSAVRTFAHYWLLVLQRRVLTTIRIRPNLPLLFKVSKLMDEEFSTGLLEFKNTMNISGKSSAQMFLGHLQKS